MCGQVLLLRTLARVLRASFRGRVFPSLGSFPGSFFLGAKVFPGAEQKLTELAKSRERWAVVGALVASNSQP